MSNLTNKTVLITGAARGIGEATARELAQRGARVGLAGLEAERLSALAKELGDRHVWAECDVTDQEALNRAIDDIAARLGGIDVVMANAGIASIGTVSIAPVEALVRVLEVNLIGVVRTASATLPYLTEKGGYFLAIASAAAFSPAPGMAAYASAKAGVEQFVNVLRMEMHAKGVGVGVAYPSWIDTDLVRDARSDLPGFDEMLRTLKGPLGRITPLDVCARELVDGMERRASRIFIPKSLRVFGALRTLFTNSLAERMILNYVSRNLGSSEEQIRELGRPFGKTSAGFGKSSRL